LKQVALVAKLGSRGGGPPFPTTTALGAELAQVEALHTVSTTL